MRQNGEADDATMQHLVGKDVLDLQAWVKSCLAIDKRMSHVDEYVLNRRRTVCVSHPKVVQRYKDEEGHKLEAIDEHMTASAASAASAFTATIPASKRAPSSAELVRHESESNLPGETQVRSTACRSLCAATRNALKRVGEMKANEIHKRMKEQRDAEHAFGCAVGPMG